jgi:hypothetical protein
MNDNELRWFFWVQIFNGLKHMWIDGVAKLNIIMIEVQVTKSSWWTLMDEINEM